MKNSALAFCFCYLFCAVSFAQVQSFYLHPSATHQSYSSVDSHFVARNSLAANGKLMLFIGGTFSKPSDYKFFSLYAAELGFHSIGVAYPNNVLTTLLASSSDSLSFDKFREEICFGTQVSSNVNVDSFNSIYTRTLNLLSFLNQTYPADGWDEFLLSPQQIDWSKITVCGHSQGAGHAAYFAKQFSTQRVLMFAGPNDYSTHFGKAAPWLRKQGVTPVSNHFAFLHLMDELVPFSRQYENLRGLGMLQNDDTTLVEDFTNGYAGSKCLYSKLTPKIAGQYHNSVVIYIATPNSTNNQPAFDSVWKYMLLSPQPTSVSDVEAEPFRFSVYPNPASSTLTIRYAGTQTLQPSIAVYDVSGRKILGRNTVYFDTATKDYTLDIEDLEDGLYFVEVYVDSKKYIAKVFVE